jgi:hypothetical protein
MVLNRVRLQLAPPETGSTGPGSQMRRLCHSAQCSLDFVGAFATLDHGRGANRFLYSQELQHPQDRQEAIIVREETAAIVVFVTPCTSLLMEKNIKMRTDNTCLFIRMVYLYPFQDQDMIATIR